MNFIGDPEPQPPPPPVPRLVFAENVDRILKEKRSAREKEKSSEMNGGLDGKDGEKMGHEEKPAYTSLEAEKAQETAEQEREQYLDNTTKYLKNCMKEIQYLLTPAQYPPPPPPPQNLPNGNFTGLPEPPLSVEDIYVRNQRRSVQRLLNDSTQKHVSCLQHCCKIEEIPNA